MQSLREMAQEIKDQRVSGTPEFKQNREFEMQEQLGKIQFAFEDEFRSLLLVLESDGITYKAKVFKYPYPGSGFYIEFKKDDRLAGMPFKLVNGECAWRFNSVQEFRKHSKADFILFIEDKLFN